MTIRHFVYPSFHLTETAESEAGISYFENHLIGPISTAYTAYR